MATGVGSAGSNPMASRHMRDAHARSAAAAAAGSAGNARASNPNEQVTDTYMNGHKIQEISTTRDRATAGEYIAGGLKAFGAAVVGAVASVGAATIGAVGTLAADGINKARGAPSSYFNNMCKAVGDGWKNTVPDLAKKVTTETKRKAPDDYVRGKGIDRTGEGCDVRNQGEVVAFINRNKDRIKETKGGKEIMMSPDDSGFFLIKRNDQGQIESARWLRVFDGDGKDLPPGQLEREMSNVLDLVDDIVKFENSTGKIYPVYTIDKSMKLLRAHSHITSDPIGLMTGKTVKVAEDTPWKEIEARDKKAEQNKDGSPSELTKSKKGVNPDDEPGARARAALNGGRPQPQPRPGSSAKRSKAAGAGVAAAAGSSRKKAKDHAGTGGTGIGSGGAASAGAGSAASGPTISRPPANTDSWGEDE